MSISFSRVFFYALLLFSGALEAQKYCSTTEMQTAWFKQQPELHEKYLQYRQKLVDFDKAAFQKETQEGNSSQRPLPATPIYTIPVVFHILHTGGPENIS